MFVLNYVLLSFFSKSGRAIRAIQLGVAHVFVLADLTQYQDQLSELKGDTNFFF